MRATIGRIVIYTLDATDAESINKRRAEHHPILDGNRAAPGDECPAVVVQDWGECANLKVLLDGNDDYWATSRHGAETPTQGCWHWPVRSE